MINQRTCALSVYFLSDGIPSDKMAGYALYSRIAELMQYFAGIYGERFSFTAVGFANSDTDFGALKCMTESLKDTESIQGSVPPCLLDGDALSKTMSSLTSSLTETSTRLSRLHGASFLPALCVM